MKQFFAALVVFVTLFSTGVAVAQTVFVQIEAQPSLNAAQDRARDYSSSLPDVNGFQLASGWYAISLGPYDVDGASARMEQLKAQRDIPLDAFLADPQTYVRQFWPVGSNALTVPVIIAPQPETDVATQDRTPVAEPEEDRRAALRSESQLSRQEKLNLQIAMKWFGFYDGAIDAAFGPGTRNSMAAWQDANGHEPTGVLTTRQRAQLTGEYEAVIASLGMAPLRDDVAGIEMELPLAMVKFDRYDPPFAHYSAIGDSGVSVLLISQTGDENTLLGLYDIMQTLEIVPLDGERNRSVNRFTLTGQNDKITSYTYAELDDGAVKGFTLIWPTGRDARRSVALNTMRDSFKTISGVVLPDTTGEGTLEQSIDLISGLQIRQPKTSRSGFYVDARGMVLTTSDAVQGCTRLTLDEVHEARIAASDAALGLVLLQPVEDLVPIDFARFQAGIPRLKSEVALSGYSFEGALGAPTMTFGTLADLKGLNGEDNMARLTLAASPGDAGGPVFDSSGSVLGMLLPTTTVGGKVLPDDVSFATDALAIAEFLSNSGFAPAASDSFAAMSAEDLTVLATNLTVLVSCWAD